ncbi:anthranilate phosphoribosyltransferase [Candidatus Karelsulcia muelleri]|uniref:anthranilate phosphoribosyltransferase n=1 Tax=Candidatus Karelsulcia muelleri TaxID=336810 RepID=UPI0007F9C600|nr:anthranilate phosphoribosyltransferase [Candidatus Karelsulcia muelleri]ANO35835.1 anthranilate phosphoribosyltransferase [Candidatus Karelsulcia muelleri]QSF25219.1 anthranilate phosphoribosyltransferase [Candidatus Karelsulcia muelleri]BEH03742.1 anthranilate phosphoribosyltransferase [Candidatus Karelsulcia muelleri]
MKDILNYLFEHKTLSKEDAQNVLISLSQDKFNHNQIAAISAIYNMRFPTLEEIKGFSQALIELSIKLNLKEYNAIDIVGTGGDNKNTFNISTLSCFIVASLGEKVIKHGSYSSSSVTGSSNIFEILQSKFTSKEEKLKKQLEKVGICYLHSHLFHPTLKKVTEVRKNLGIKTFFNMLGPLLNTSNTKNQLLGVSDLELARLYYYLYQETDKNYSIVHSLDGYDEISLTSVLKCYDNQGEHIFYPEDFGIKKINPLDLKGGKNNIENTRIFLDIISGNGTVYQNDVVSINASFALSLLNECSITTNYYKAQEALKSGKAKKILKKFLEI